ncbi:MAG: hypothetical protein ACK4V1_13630, partial [Burkholderiaceae bacterium]
AYLILYTLALIPLLPLLRRIPVHDVARPAPNDWVKIPTRTTPPVVVSGEASKKRLIADAIAAPAPTTAPRDAGGSRPDRRSDDRHVRPQPREVAPPAVERRPDGERVRAMPMPERAHEVPPKRAQPAPTVPAQPPVATPVQPAPASPAPRGVESEPRQPAKRVVPAPEGIRPPLTHAPAPGGRSQPRADAPRVEPPRVAPPGAEPPREQIRPQPRERGPVESGPRSKVPAEQAVHERRGKLQMRPE